MVNSPDRETSRHDIDRLVAFSDGVFAIAITLLVLSIQVPNLAQGSNLNQQLWQAIQDQNQEIFAYFLSFVVIGRYWLIHHRVFRLVVSADSTLFSLNLLLLSLIAFMPYATEVYGRYPGTPATVTLYSLTVGLTGVVQAILLEHLDRKKLLSPKVRPDLLSTARPRAIFIPIVFLSAIPLSFFTDAAWLIWVIGLIVGQFLFVNPFASFSDPYSDTPPVKRKIVIRRAVGAKKKSTPPKIKK